LHACGKEECLLTKPEQEEPLGRWEDNVKVSV